MKEIVLQVPENDAAFLLQLLGELRFVKIVERPAAEAVLAEKMEILRSIRQGLDEARAIQNGQLPRKTLREMLAEAA